MTKLTQALFYPSRAERVELARRRYFDEGVAPTGVITDAVFESWTRCQRFHADPAAAGHVLFQAVTASRTHLALQKNRHLRESWMEELPALQNILRTTSCAAMLTDATGVMIGAACVGRSHEHLMPIATRLGVDLSEEAVGTTAPGVAARTGQPVCVLGAEHYFHAVKEMNCAAWPIRDIHGQVAGVLDISSEKIPFAFDVASIVGLFGGAIENRLLVAQSCEHLIVYLQVAASLLDSPVVGLVGVDASGRVSWCNGVASRLMGAAAPAPPAGTATSEALLGKSASALAALPSSGGALMRLPNGLTVWARSVMRAPDGHRKLTEGHCHADALIYRAEDSVAQVRRAVTHDTRSPPCKGDQSNPSTIEVPTSLSGSDRDLIKRTIEECGGNISRAAKTLGVSRGLIYRRLRGSMATNDPH